MKPCWQLRYIISKHHGGYPGANWVSRKANKHTKTTHRFNTSVTWMCSTNIGDNVTHTTTVLTL